MDKEIIKKISIPSSSKIIDAIKILNLFGSKIVFVINRGTLIGSISDGDIRRGIAQGFSLESSVLLIIHKNCITVPAGLANEEIIRIMTVNKIQQIPAVDTKNKVVGLFTWENIIFNDKKFKNHLNKKRNNLMVIMAGGKGVRLRPYTENCPKPMLTFNNKPILQHIIEKAKEEGFYNFIISINYLGKKIKKYFQNGSHLGIKITYIEEADPLGTIGSLSLLTSIPRDDFIVVNGDVISDLDFSEFLAFHKNNNAVASMAVKKYEFKNPYGVINLKGIDISGIEEKPSHSCYVNAGVYALKPIAIKGIKKNTYMDATDLISNLISKGKKIIAYPIHEKWNDIGAPEDYKELINANKRENE